MSLSLSKAPAKKKKMRANSVKRFFALSMALGFIAAGSVTAFAEVVDKIAIVVNDEIICDSEIENTLYPVYQRYKTIYAGDKLMEKLEEARQRAIEQLIEDKLILSEAKKLNIEVSDKEINARLEEVKRNFGSEEDFENAILDQRMTIKDLKARYKEQMMTRKLIDQNVGARIAITPIDVNNYYNSHLGEFAQEEALKLRNILIRPKDDSDVQRALDLAKDIEKKLKDGADFAQAAKAYSEGPGAGEGGMIGYVKKGDLLPEIETVVFNLKEGEVSDIIQTSLGYHIFKLEEKREARTLTLREARRDAEEAIFREKIKEKIKDWVESLKKNAYIAFK